MKDNLNKIIEEWIWEDILSGLERNFLGLESLPDGDWRINGNEVKAYNKALQDLRNKIPDVTDKIVDMVVEEIEKIPTNSQEELKLLVELFPHGNSDLISRTHFINLLRNNKL